MIKFQFVLYALLFNACLERSLFPILDFAVFGASSKKGTDNRSEFIL